MWCSLTISHLCVVCVVYGVRRRYGCGITNGNNQRIVGYNTFASVWKMNSKVPISRTFSTSQMVSTRYAMRLFTLVCLSLLLPVWLVHAYPYVCVCVYEYHICVIAFCCSIFTVSTLKMMRWKLKQHGKYKTIYKILRVCMCVCCAVRRKSISSTITWLNGRVFALKANGFCLKAQKYICVTVCVSPTYTKRW